MSDHVGYSIDTNCILTAWHSTYRPASFSGFWTKFAELIAEGRAFASEEVLNELEKKEDDAFAWAKAQDGFKVPLEEEQVALVRELAKEHPALGKERMGRGKADGFVIALAQWKGLTVVTSENHRGPEKIPNICAASGVDCIPLADMITAEGWTFS